jgi:hypothetical protein
MPTLHQLSFMPQHDGIEMAIIAYVREETAHVADVHR